MQKTEVNERESFNGNGMWNCLAGWPNSFAPRRMRFSVQGSQLQRGSPWVSLSLSVIFIAILNTVIIIVASAEKKIWRPNLKFWFLPLHICKACVCFTNTAWQEGICGIYVQRRSVWGNEKKMDMIYWGTSFTYRGGNIFLSLLFLPLWNPEWIQW